MANEKMFRVVRVAPAAFSPPCPCSIEEPHIVWEGDDPDDYREGYGAFDEGCHHPTRWFEGRDAEGKWVELRGDPRAPRN